MGSIKSYVDGCSLFSTVPQTLVFKSTREHFSHASYIHKTALIEVRVIKQLGKGLVVVQEALGNNVFELIGEQRLYKHFSTVVLSKLLELLKKRSEKTPYNYTEYEPMRSVFLMPYLLEHYGYECFRVFNGQLEKQYNDMPNCFKGIFTLDEFGNIRSLRNKEEVEKSWREFWGR